MEVFLIPLGADRYELYCEAPHAEPEVGEDAARARGLFGRLRQRFSDVLAAAERDRNRPGDATSPPDGLWERLKYRALAWIADAIAEQRLLWHLRHQEEATLVHPADMEPERALEIMRASLARDRDRHRFWLIVDGFLLILSGLLVLVPGPNLVAYYFAFRVVGHFLAWRGARQGLMAVKWRLQPSEPLAELRHAMRVPPVAHERLAEIASRLRLDHLATFVERVAYPGARMASHDAA